MLVAAGLSLAACSNGTVTVATPTPSPPPSAATACAALAEALPPTVDGAARRTTEPASVLTAAWGDPAIVLTCGVPVPSGLGPTSELVVVDGVDWFPQDLTRGVRFSTVGRVATVQVDVPAAYAPEAQALVDLAAAITTTVPKQ